MSLSKMISIPSKSDRTTPKLCVVCRKNISDRGNRSDKCIECQKKSRYTKKNTARNKKYSERKIVGDNFYLEDGVVRHISSSQTVETDFLDRECSMCNIDDMPGMVTLRRGEMKEIIRHEMSYARKLKDWDEVKRIENEINKLRREIKMITDWYGYRRETDTDYWRMKEEEWRKRFEGEDSEGVEDT